MANSDVFGLPNSSLNTFLFAYVGTEQNGSALTILSTLARLGLDPWVEAARWASLPKPAAVNCLAQSIVRMPLKSQELAEAPIIAARLVLLLPAPSHPLGQSAGKVVARSGVPPWVQVAALGCALALGLMVSVVLASKPISAVTAPVGQAIEHTL